MIFIGYNINIKLKHCLIIISQDKLFKDNKKSKNLK
jgi:hypothetical protein